MPETKISIYPGSFDPPTNGHLDLIERGARMFGHVIVAILRNENKASLFTPDERAEMLREALKHLDNVSVESFDGLLVNFAAERGARVILRGIRAVSDYEYELQMALMNRALHPDLETVFMLPGEAYSYISSRMVKEVYRLGGDISHLVPPVVEQWLEAKGRIKV